MVFEWGKVCGDATYYVSYRLDFCISKGRLDDFKEGGNGESEAKVARVHTVTDGPAVYNILMDFIFAAFPWLITWKLNMKKSEKIGLCVVMSLVCCLRHPAYWQP